MENKKNSLSEEFDIYDHRDPYIEFVGSPGDLKIRNDKFRKAFILNNKGKIISLVIAIFYLIFGNLILCIELLRIIKFLIVPMSLIWFSEIYSPAMLANLRPLSGVPVRGTSKGPVPIIIVKIFSWFFLFWPIMALILTCILSGGDFPIFPLKNMCKFQ